MIHELYMKNCALVEEARVNFGEKLNILTGETGSGKSIILEGLNLCFGGKYDRTFLRKGTEIGEVEIVVFSDNEKFLKRLNSIDVDIPKGEAIIVSRKLFQDGKSTTKINGKNIRVSDLKFVMSSIVDMHGQHQNQALYNKENHIEFVDIYGKEELSSIFKEYQTIFEEFNDIKKRIYRMNDNKSDMEVQREKDLLKFQINEISAANLSKSEFDELKKQRDIVANSEKIFNSLSEVYELIHNGQINSEDNVGKSFSLLSDIIKYDEKISEISESTEKVMYELQEISLNIRNYLDRIDFEPHILNEIEARMDVINTLRRKYGNTIDEILKYHQEMLERLDNIDNREERIENLKKELNIKKKELEIVGKKLSETRKKIASDLERSLLLELSSLNMKNTKFKVNFKKTDYNENGCDDIEFFVSFNLGEDLNPLNKIASGGEMSRFMLAFKSILSNLDKIDTLIFDEIDSGISGRAAQIVGEKLSAISNNKQIICITHLPQIASFADHHYHIEKNVEKNRTNTSITLLDDKVRTNEIARLISGKIITEKTVQHAIEILEIAEKIKKSNENLGG
ncbi:DNA repair protein RecN [Peptostreptococcus canis]|uniref:DNA repair protein RecN n=1 Tax=Peptostreptococcus canis TaxID=1159213 RepID=A0ABR6TMV0_9FIRM|nr:DNA repair protein RecN [Peptostreptococcus canis]MBC2576489.1 DNA repair protein RecN [Peptostreptococcus canis]MBP1998675.1 DNA repair protein RecN (Recombination protein N) [Peptostreptococcus canis]